MKLIIFLIIVLSTAIQSANAAAVFCIPKASAALSGLKQIALVPGTGGATFFDRKIQSMLCELGYKVALIDSDIDYKNFDIDFGVHDRYVNIFLGTLQTALQESPEPTAIIGSSLGGIFASIAFAKNEELFQGLLQSAIIISAGGSLAEVIEASELAQLKKLRNQRRQHYSDMNDAEITSKLKEAITLDPHELANGEKRKSVLMYISQFDKVVPTVMQAALWNAWGQPEVRKIPLAHISTIAFVLLARIKEISSFIQNQSTLCKKLF